MPVVDTNFVIRLAAGDPAALRAVPRARQDGPLVLPAIVAIEFLAGVSDPVASLHALTQGFNLVQTDEAQILKAAQLRSVARARAAGRPHWGDVQVAAVAAIEGTYVITSNKRHFTQLGVAAWHFADESEPPTQP